MTEFVGGGTFLWSVFQVIRERLASSVITDYFDEQLVHNLEVTLDSINEVLDDAETRQFHNLSVKKWVNNLKHLLYEVEQLLDVVAIDAQGKGKIGRFISATINRFESRIKVLLKRLVVLSEEYNRLGLKENSYEIRASQQLSMEFTTGIYGREHEKEEIISFLLAKSYCDDQVPIITIVGLTGMGKTTLAQLVFNDHRIIEQFDIKVWVHVSESFVRIRLTRSILESIHSSAVDCENLDILQCELQRRLAGKRYLLVLDDVWNKD
ncbi:CC-NBS-LRR resistance protein, partial [Trifolium pratense]